jgi:hypothetical protein
LVARRGGRGRRGERAHRLEVGAPLSRVHVCIDDATRLAYVEVLADEKATTCIGFLKRALRFY